MGEEVDIKLDNPHAVWENDRGTRSNAAQRADVHRV